MYSTNETSSYLVLEISAYNLPQILYLESSCPVSSLCVGSAHSDLALAMHCSQRCSCTVHVSEWGTVADMCLLEMEFLLWAPWTTPPPRSEGQSIAMLGVAGCVSSLKLSAIILWELYDTFSGPKAPGIRLPKIKSWLWLLWPEVLNISISLPIKCKMK